MDSDLRLEDSGLHLEEEDLGRHLEEDSGPRSEVGLVLGDLRLDGIQVGDLRCLPRE